MPEAQYFLLQTGLSRGQDDATAKKKVCTWHREYFRLDTETGLLTSVNEMEDGLLWFSSQAPLKVPAAAVGSTQGEYNAAFKRWRKYDDKLQAQVKKDKDFRKQCQAGDIYGLHPERTKQRISRKELELALADAGAERVFPAAAELIEASLPRPVVEVVAQPATPAPAAEASLPLATGAQLLDDFTVLDLEFQGEQLLELAAIRYQGMQPVGEYVSFVQFRGAIWRPVSELTGITALHVYDAPAEVEVLKAFKKLAGDSLLVCHNIAADKRILEAARTRQGAKAELPNAWLCTLALARRRVKAGLLPKDQKCGLVDLCQQMQVKALGAHRAKVDVQRCFGVLRKLHEQQPLTKADLHGAPQPGKGRKILTPTGPGLFAAA